MKETFSVDKMKKLKELVPFISDDEIACVLQSVNNDVDKAIQQLNENFGVNYKSGEERVAESSESLIMQTRTAVADIFNELIKNDTQRTKAVSDMERAEAKVSTVISSVDSKSDLDGSIANNQKIQKKRAVSDVERSEAKLSTVMNSADSKYDGDGAIANNQKIQKKRAVSDMERSEAEVSTVMSSVTSKYDLDGSMAYNKKIQNKRCIPALKPQMSDLDHHYDVIYPRENDSFLKFFGGRTTSFEQRKNQLSAAMDDKPLPSFAIGRMNKQDREVMVEKLKEKEKKARDDSRNFLDRLGFK